MRNPVLTVRKVKTFQGRKGEGFNAELVVDGKPVCFVIDEANGGMFHYDWYKGTDTEEAMFDAVVANLPERPYGHGMAGMFKPDADSLMDDLVNKYANWKK